MITGRHRWRPLVLRHVFPSDLARLARDGIVITLPPNLLAAWFEGGPCTGPKIAGKCSQGVRRGDMHGVGWVVAVLEHSLFRDCAARLVKFAYPIVFGLPGQPFRPEDGGELGHDALDVEQHRRRCARRDSMRGKI